MALGLQTTIRINEYEDQGFLGGSVVKNLPAKAGDMGSTPDSRKSHMPVEQ